MTLSPAEETVWQVLIGKAASGTVSISYRDLAYLTGLSKSTCHRTIARLIEEGHLEVAGNAEGPLPPTYTLVSQTLSHGLILERENAIPTMPFQLPALSGQAGSWWSQAFQAITRARSDPNLLPDCSACLDVGLYVERTSVAYSRSWLRSCSCEASEALPDSPDFVPERSIGLCPMCENTGWVDLGDEVQRCHSCRRTYA